MSRVKKLKIKQPDGSFSEYVDIAADATQIDLADGTSVQDTVVEMQEDIKELQAKEELDPTVPEYVKDITEDDIDS